MRPVGYGSASPRACRNAAADGRVPASAQVAGDHVDLCGLPMSGGVHGPTAANEASSWVNNTHVVRRA